MQTLRRQARSHLINIQAKLAGGQALAFAFFQVGALGGGIEYRPIPRDRDHAFFKFNDGLLTHIIGWLKPNYQTFSEDIRLSVRKVATRWTGKKPIVDVLIVEA